MAIAIGTIFLIISVLALEYVTEDNTGCCNVRHMEPAIAGRYVRFVLTYFSLPRENSSVQWRIHAGLQNITVTHNTSTIRTFKMRSEFFLDYLTSDDQDDVTVVVQFDDQILTHSVHLEEASDCGTIRHEGIAVAGQNVRFVFIPGTSRNTSVDWYIYNNTWHKAHTSMIRSSPFERYREAIFDYKTSLDHRLIDLYVHPWCQGSVYQLNLIEPPSQPVINNQYEIEGFGRGIVGYTGEFVQIQCETHYGENPVVSLYVGNNRTRMKPQCPYYTTILRVDDILHDVPVRCEVTSAALRAPIVAETKLYVLRTPQTPFINVSTLEGLLEITCTTTGGRPVPNLTLDVDNGGDTEVITRKTTSADDGMIVSTVRIEHVDWAWSRWSIQCCIMSDVHQESCSRLKAIFQKEVHSETREVLEKAGKRKDSVLRWLLYCSCVVICAMTVIIVSMLVRNKRTRSRTVTISETEHQSKITERTDGDNHMLDVGTDGEEVNESDVGTHGDNEETEIADVVFNSTYESNQLDLTTINRRTRNQPMMELVTIPNTQTSFMLGKR